jgi:hypothetical protein
MVRILCRIDHLCTAWRMNDFAFLIFEKGLLSIPELNQEEIR